MLNHASTRRLFLKQGVATAAAAAGLLGWKVTDALALDGSYGKANNVGDGKFAASSYNVTVKKTLYQYETGKDGKAYYATFNGKDWSDWQTWKSQPEDYQYDPAPVVYGDQAYVVYYGKSGNYYYSAGGGDWTDLSQGQTFKCAPYANVYNNILYVYGTGSDGYVYWKHYDGSEWSAWFEIGDQTTSAYEVYAVDWNGYDNVFWTSDDGSVYWNRWDGSAWTGTKALPGDGKVKYAPYAVGYEPEKKLYGYTVTAKGAPAWSVFTEGEGWTGWKPYDGLDAKVTNQPNAYVYKDIQHLVFTGTDGHAYYTEYDGKWADEWKDLGSNYAYDPYQYEYDGDLYLTYTGKNGAAYVKPYEPESGGY